jgi:DNA-directed RNA polymerase subunit RPC12/RpoP
MRYICLDCNAEFDEPTENKKIESRFIRYNILRCTYCSSNRIRLSEQGKLLVERRAKIKTIENESTKSL